MCHGAEMEIVSNYHSSLLERSLRQVERRAVAVAVEAEQQPVVDLVVESSVASSSQDALVDHQDRDLVDVGLLRVHQDVVDIRDDIVDTVALDGHRDSLAVVDSLVDKACDRRVDTVLSVDIHVGDIDHAAAVLVEDVRLAEPCQDERQL